ncbi:MAG TPA: hypothetical protein VGD81_14480 [Opitutaceae bacterium]
MKLLALLLVGSLAANAVLVGALVVRPPRPTSDNSALSAETNSARDQGGAAAATADSGPPVPRRQIWVALNADDLETYVGNLRAAGFPERTVRALANLALSERNTERRKALEGATEPRPYWREQSSWTSHDPKTQAALRELWREQRETLKRLFGSEPFEDSSQVLAWRERQYGSLSREKIEEVNRLQEDYRELTSEIHRAARGMLLAEDREKLAFLEKEKLADLQAILNPDELLELQLRTSPTANRLRNEFRDVDLTEPEFRALHALRTPFDEQFSDPAGSRRPDQAEARRKAEEELHERYRSILGEERYAEYQRARDGNYNQLRRLTQRLDLPKETAVRVHELQKSTEQRVNEIRRDAKLTPEERNARLGALAADAKGTISTALGARGYEAYLEFGGYWLRNLETPKPRPASPPK